MNKDHLARQPNPVDLHVGMRIRARRKSLGLSQDKLAMALGLTFQQVQKYERGANRISASKLYEAARILGVPIPFFFEGLPVLVDDDAAHSAGQGLGDAFTRFMATQGALELAELFPRISNAKIRRHVVGMCKAMADVGDQNAKVAWSWADFPQAQCGTLTTGMRPAEDTCAPDEANMRAGVRIATDYVLRWTVTALRKHDGDILEALVLACLSCADTPILGAEHGLRPLRINQVAASLHLPMETVRRRFIALQDKGFIRQTKEGYVIAPLERDASLEQALAHLPQIRRLLRELAAVGVKV